MIEVLLELGADVNKVTGLGSALHNACAYENVEVVDILLKYNIDIDIRNADGCLAKDMTENKIIKNKLAAYIKRKAHR